MGILLAELFSQPAACAPNDSSMPPASSSDPEAAPLLRNPLSPTLGPANSARSPSGNGRKYVTIRLGDSSGREVTFKMSTTTPFAVLRQVYCSRFLIPIGSIELRRVNDDGGMLDVPLSSNASDLSLRADSTAFMWASSSEGSGK